MQNTKTSHLKRKRIDIHRKPDLLEWQILWIAEHIPREALISGVCVFLSDLGEEVGIEIEYEIEGLERVSQGFMN